MSPPGIDVTTRGTLQNSAGLLIIPMDVRAIRLEIEYKEHHNGSGGDDE